jgi:nitroreductase
VMTMTARSHPARAESVPQPRLSAVTDQGGLYLGRTIRRSASATTMPAPGEPLTPAAAAAVVGIAARAPSVHNTQPWRFRIADGVIELHADPDRLLARIDPAGRELLLSCGAALFGLRLGLRQLGCLPVAELWPDAAQPWLIARAWPADHMALNAVEAELLAAVPHRHTHRGPFTPGEVSPRLLAALAADAAAEGAELRFVEQPDLVAGLATLVELAAVEQDASAEISAETHRWLRPAGSQARDGVPARAAAVGGETGAPRFRQRDFGADAGRAAPDIAEDSGVPPAATAVLATAADTPDDWLRAGQALNRLLLRAATRWVFASLQSQPLESPRYRERVRDLLELPGQPQMLLQFGRANTAPTTPRRPQTEFRTNENPG